MKRVALFILVGLVGLYLGSWAGIAHASEWWSYPTLILGLIMAACGVIGLAYYAAIDRGI